jgi:outer membrane protein
MTPRLSRAARAATLLAGLALAPGLALAQSQPFRPVGDQPDLTLDIGGGGVYGFGGLGGETDRVNPIPWGSLNWKGRVYANPLDGLGYNAVKTDTFRAGFQVRPHYGGASVDELERPGLGADLAAYAFVRVPGNVSIGGRITRDISGQSDGTEVFASVSQQTVTRVGLLQSTAYVRAGDRRSNSAYYGVTPEQSAATGVPVYDLDSGFQSAGIAFLLMAPLGDDWAVGGFVNAETALGEVADSPLIQDRDQGEMAYRGGVLVVRRFKW